MSFRLFGRPRATADRTPPGWTGLGPPQDDAASSSGRGAAAPGSRAEGGPGPATAAARPARRRPTDDPPTDPVGFAPVGRGDGPYRSDPAADGLDDPLRNLAVWPTTREPGPGFAPLAPGPAAPPDEPGSPSPPDAVPPPAAPDPLPYDTGPGADLSPTSGATRRGPRVDPPEPGPSSADPTVPAGMATDADPFLPDHAESAALAAAFAADYLSWDEDDAARRGTVLQGYLVAPGPDPAHLGWSGRGRQRADFALPGRVHADGTGRVLVDVRVRVTPYRAVGDRGSPAPENHDHGGVPAAAPAPTGRGWRSLPAVWVRFSVPVVVDGDRLAVDAGEEDLGDDAVLPRADGRPGPPTDGRSADRADEDPSLVDDAPSTAPADGAP